MGKLLKQEYRAYIRYAIALYITILALSVFNGLVGLFFYNYYDTSGVIAVLEEQLSLPIIMLTAVYGVTCLAATVVWVAAPIIALARYHGSIFTDEGYLTMVLPFKNEEIFDTKVLAGVIFSVASYLVSDAGQLLGDYIASLGKGGYLTTTATFFGLFFEDYGSSSEAASAVITYVSTFLTLLFAFLLGYFVITLSCVAFRNGRKILGFLIYVGSFIFIALVVTLVLSMVSVDFSDYGGAGDYASVYYRVMMMESVISGVAYLCGSAGAYFGARGLIMYKFNLE